MLRFTLFSASLQGTKDNVHKGFGDTKDRTIHRCQHSSSEWKLLYHYKVVFSSWCWIHLHRLHASLEHSNELKIVYSSMPFYAGDYSDWSLYNVQRRLILYWTKIFCETHSHPSQFVPERLFLVWVDQYIIFGSTGSGACRWHLLLNCTFCLFLVFFSFFLV